MKRFVITLFLFVVSFMLFAESWTLQEQDGFLSTLVSKDKKTTNVISETSLNNTLIEKIGNCLDTIWAIPGLKGKEASVKVDSDGVFRLVVYPTDFTYKEINLKDFLPSGIGFLYNSALFYDVTLKVNDFMPKTAGAYISPDDFLEELRTATIMPDMYMADTYMFKRIERLETAVMALSKKSLFTKATKVNEEVVIAVRSLYNENPSITQKEVVTKLKEKGMQVTTNDVNAVFMVYLGIIPEK